MSPSEVGVRYDPRTVILLDPPITPKLLRLALAGGFEPHD
jgi:hypothetical protein